MSDTLAAKGADALARARQVLDAADTSATMLSEETKLVLSLICLCHPEWVDAVVELINKARIAEARSCTCLGGGPL